MDRFGYSFPCLSASDHDILIRWSGEHAARFYEDHEKVIQEFDVVGLSLLENYSTTFGKTASGLIETRPIWA
jgi:hypothetical protein